MTDTHQPNTGTDAQSTTDAEYRISSEALARDVERVVDELGHAPTIQEYDDHGVYAPGTIANRFGDGSWPEALTELGYPIRQGKGRRIDSEVLAADVRRIADEVGHPPTCREYTAHGQHKPLTIANRLGDGSWVTALERLGYDIPDRRRNLSADTLRQDIEQVVAQLGRPPKVLEYKELGSYAPATISSRFGDGFWPDALYALGYDPSQRSDGPISDNALQKTIEQVVGEVGHPPPRAEFAERSEFDPQTVANRFGNGLWKPALANLGYDVSDRQEPNTIPDEALRADLEQVVDERGGVPTAREYDDHGQFAAQTIANRFGAGSWTDALETLGFARSRSTPRNSISADMLREDIRRVVDDLGRVPTTTEYDALGNHCTGTVAKRFGNGSWPAALRELGYDPPAKTDISEQNLRDDVAHIVEHFGHVPTKGEYTDHGTYSGTTIANRFGNGSWTAALERLGYQVSEQGDDLRTQNGN